MYQIIKADITEWLKDYQDKPFHAALFDPPYHLTSITERFGKEGSAPARDGVYNRGATGFMGKNWDGGDLIFQPETWQLLSTVLHPGAFVMAYCGSRGWHRQAVAMEDGGFTFHPSIFMFGMAFGAGFPKATRIDTQIDAIEPRKGMFDSFSKHFKEQRKLKKLSHKQIAIHFPSKTGGLTGCVWNWENGESVPTLEQWKTLQPLLNLSEEYLPLIERVKTERKVIDKKQDSGQRYLSILPTEKIEFNITKPTTPLAETWQGYRYGLQLIKPATEILLTGYKPLNCEPIYSIIPMNTYFIEVMLCLFSSVQDAESLINQIHKSLQVVVERSAHGNVDVWELLKNVNFVEVNSELNLTKSTLLNFVVDNALTKEGMHQVLNEVKVGLSVKDTSISEQIQDMLQRVGTLWHNILEEILNLGNMSTILTESELITDLKTCNFYLLEIMQDYIVKSEPIGLQLHVSIVENSLKNLFAKLQLLKTTIVTENVIDKLVSQDKNQEGKRKSILEPILVGQKPYQGKPVENITETGAGAINVDGGRIGTDVNRGNRYNNKSPNKGKNSTVNLGKRIEKWDVSPGRWPSNLILHHLPGCKRIGVKRVRGSKPIDRPDGFQRFNTIDYNSGKSYITGEYQSTGYADSDGYETVTEWQCVEGCPVKIVGEQSGNNLKGGSKTGNEPSRPMSNVYSGGLNRQSWEAYSDSGTAARYFQQPDWSYEIYEQLNNADLLQYITKPSTTEREAGLEKLPFGTLHRTREGGGGLSDDPKFAPVERKNTHPTVKSIALNKYLATLLLPPPEYAPRRILVPFCGSGSEIIGCLLAGWDEVIGIELEQEYYDIASERVAWWYGVMESCNYDVDNIIKHWQKEQKVSETGQLRLL